MLLYGICELTEPLWVAIVCVCWWITDIQMLWVRFVTPDTKRNSSSFSRGNNC
ncbi:hypothetical protein BGX38DRAFT_1166407 [Terfezia claveryi]|nr:hypothetical protein BGX38DRAFT_1166407 [Terfezia claveryi]